MISLIILSISKLLPQVNALAFVFVAIWTGFGCGKKKKDANKIGPSKSMMTGATNMDSGHDKPTVPSTVQTPSDKSDCYNYGYPLIPTSKFTGEASEPPSAVGTAPKEGAPGAAAENKDKPNDGKPPEEKKDAAAGKDDGKKKDESVKIKPYPDVKEPTNSQKKKKDDALEKEKKDKIAKGFYQSKSDEDDTLEKVNSLKEEQSEASRKKSEKKAKEKKK